MRYEEIAVAAAVGIFGAEHRAFAHDSWPAKDEVRALVAEVMADAQFRTSLLNDGAMSGHDGKFFLADATGAFRLNVGGQVQFRYTLNFREKSDALDVDDFESGFSVPRARVSFDGTVYSPKLFYRVMMDARPDSGDGFLQDAWMGYNFDGGWTIRAGQGITAFMREWYMGDQKLIFPERSLQSFMFGQFRSQFVDLKYQTDDVPLRAIVTFSDGFRSANTDFTFEPADYAVTGRVEWRYAGAWKQLVDDFRGPPGGEYAGAIGAAAHFEQGQNAPEPPGEQSLFAWTADLLTKGDGWSIMLAGVGYDVRDEAGIDGADFDDFGALAQAGISVSENVELVGRFDAIFPDSDRDGSSTFNTITAGLNWYLHGHAAKLNLAAMWFLDDTQDTVAGNFAGAGGRTPTSSAFGPLPSAEQHQVTLMFQFQLLF